MAETLLSAAKVACRVTAAETAYDSELTDLIAAARADLGIARITGTDEAAPDALTKRAILTYCRLHFGSPPDYDKLKASYDEQKGQLQHATGHTVWEVTA